MKTEFAMKAVFDGEPFGFDLPLLVVDDSFFEYLEDETDYEGGSLDIGEFALYYLEWEKENAEHVS